VVIIEGTVDGDLFAIAGDVDISGTVQGDVIGLVGGSVRISGEVTGSVRVAAVETQITGEVGDDVAVAALEVAVDGEVGRDLLAAAGGVDLAGRVGRDVRLQSLRLSIDGVVGADVLARVDSLTVGEGATVGGDLLYRASADASVADGAVVDGRLSRQTVIAPVWAKAVSRAITVLSLLAVIVGGLIGLWVFRSTSIRAVSLAGDEPWRSGLVGAALVVGLPLLALPLFLTLVGIPVALLVLVAWGAALVLGPIPAVTRIGTAAMRGRGGLAVGLVIGVVVWRGLMWLLPLVSGLLYLVALVIGLGAFGRAGWSLRHQP
jgi:cytoskeletal protein CcmA (bactofilin family)